MAEVNQLSIQSTKDTQPLCSDNEHFHHEIIKNNTHKSILLVFKGKVLGFIKLKGSYTFYSLVDHNEILELGGVNISQTLGLIQKRQCI